MKFEHVDAKTVGEAVSLLNKSAGKAQLLAGGTDLLGVLKDSILPTSPDVVINLKTIKGLTYIKRAEGELRIGALTKLVDIAESSVVKGQWGALAEAAEAVATPNIRNMATLAGNLCQDVRCWYYRYPHHVGSRILCYRKGGSQCFAVTGDNRYHAILGGKVCFAVNPSDTAVALTALDATIKVAGAKGEKTIPISKFYTPLGTVLKTDEIVTEIQVPTPLQATKQTFLKSSVRKTIDFALVSVASAITVKAGVCEDVRIALGGVAPTPVRANKAEAAVKGKHLDATVAEAAGNSAVTGAMPLPLNNYKVEMAKSLVKNALLSCAG